MFVEQNKAFETILCPIRTEFEQALNYFANRDAEFESLRIKLTDMESEISSKTQSSVSKYAKEVFKLRYEPNVKKSNDDIVKKIRDYKMIIVCSTKQRK
jgi:uncharacterized protein YdcH (DUF465 family)